MTKMKSLVCILFLSSCMSNNDDMLNEVKHQLKDLKNDLLLNQKEVSSKEDSVSTNSKLWDDRSFVLRLSYAKSNGEALKMQIQSIEKLIDSVQRK